MRDSEGGGSEALERAAKGAPPAFIVSAYKLPGQLVRLVDRLSGGGATFWIHVDRKAPTEVQRSVRERLAGRPDVTLLPQHACHWGDFGHVRASLKGIRALLSSGRPFGVAILLTGQCYPIRSRAAIDGYFRERAGQSFLEGTPFPIRSWPDCLDRVERWHWWLGNRFYYFPGAKQFRTWWVERAWCELLERTGLERMKRRVPFPERFFGGSGYWCLSPEAVRYVDRFVADRPDFVSFFRRVLCPDEVFFQTVLFNSPLAPTVVSSNLRYIDWSRPRARSPKVLGGEDFAAMTASGALFARKFDETADTEVLDRIDAELLGVARVRERRA